MIKVTPNELRNKFLNFFKEEQINKISSHAQVQSSDIAINNDQSLLFVNSGMVQFKNLFLKLQEPTKGKHNVVSIQKCLRAGGKHNDLNNVGYTKRHHTFFEMLGNFAFGTKESINKENAIELAWRFLTEELQINPEKMYITVHAEDDASLKAWKGVLNKFQINNSFIETNIIKVDTQDNWWAMGNTGPCGYCSEIYYDNGHTIPGSLNASGCHGERYTEIWNLVFMQYNTNETLYTKYHTALQQWGKDIAQNKVKPKQSNIGEPLNQICIDTGAGFERLVAVLEGKLDNYETSLFTPIISQIKQTYNVSNNHKHNTHCKIIADHIRTICFLIAEGIMPSNEKQGYVLRKIMRRAIRYAREMNNSEPKLHLLVPIVIKIMGQHYPELQKQEELITKTIQSEENNFQMVLTKGIKELQQYIEKIKNNNISLKQQDIEETIDEYLQDPVKYNIRPPHQLISDIYNSSIGSGYSPNLNNLTSLNTPSLAYKLLSNIENNTLNKADKSELQQIMEQREKKIRKAFNDTQKSQTEEHEQNNKDNYASSPKDIIEQHRKIEQILYDINFNYHFNSLCQAIKRGHKIDVQPNIATTITTPLEDNVEVLRIETIDAINREELYSLEHITEEYIDEIKQANATNTTVDITVNYSVQNHHEGDFTYETTQSPISNGEYAEICQVCNRVRRAYKDAQRKADIIVKHMKKLEEYTRCHENTLRQNEYLKEWLPIFQREIVDELKKVEEHFNNEGEKERIFSREGICNLGNHIQAIQKGIESAKTELEAEYDKFIRLEKYPEGELFDQSDGFKGISGFLGGGLLQPKRTIFFGYYDTTAAQAQILGLVYQRIIKSNKLPMLNVQLLQKEIEELKRKYELNNYILYLYEAFIKGLNHNTTNEGEDSVKNQNTQNTFHYEVLHAIIALYNVTQSRYTNGENTWTNEHRRNTYPPYQYMFHGFKYRCNSISLSRLLKMVRIITTSDNINPFQNIWYIYQNFVLRNNLPYGYIVAKLYDTLGMPSDITIDILAEENGWDEAQTIDVQRCYENCIEALQTKNQNANAMQHTATHSNAKPNLSAINNRIHQTNQTIFHRDAQSCTSTLEQVSKASIINGKQTYNAIQCKQTETINFEQGENLILEFTETTFYPEGGGQLGDKGWISIAGTLHTNRTSKQKHEQNNISNTNCTITTAYTQHNNLTENARNALLEVYNTTKIGNTILHHATVLQSFVHNNANEYLLTIDSYNRQGSSIHHSATHLLHAALRQYLGQHVIQKGSQIYPDQLRFDFTHTKDITQEDILEIESIVNNTALCNLQVTAEQHSKDEAISIGAMALFGEKYEDKVRVISMLPSPNKQEKGQTNSNIPFSIELCNGTHVKQTGEIGAFKILTVQSIGTGLKRITAIAGMSSYKYMQKCYSILKPIEQSNKIHILEQKNEHTTPSIEEIIHISQNNPLLQLIQNSKNNIQKLQNIINQQALNIIKEDIKTHNNTNRHNTTILVVQTHISDINILDRIANNIRDAAPQQGHALILIMEDTQTNNHYLIGIRKRNDNQSKVDYNNAIKEMLSKAKMPDIHEGRLRPPVLRLQISNQDYSILQSLIAVKPNQDIIL